MISPKALWQKENLLKAITLVVLMTSLGIFVTYKITLPAAEDLPRQMMNGKDILSGNFDVLYKNVYSYTDTGHEFANHHWLYGVFAYVLYSLAGFSGIVLFKVILFLLLFGILFYTSTRRANFWLVAIFSVPTIIMLLGRSAARPEMFSYLFAVLYLYFLTRFEDKPTTKILFWLIPLQLLWANLHILFPAGIAIVGAFWLSAVIKAGRQAVKNYSVRILTLLLFLMSTVSFINPLGVRGVLYSLAANTIGATKIFSAEVQSIASVFRSEPKMDYLGAAIFLPMIILLGLSFVVSYKKKNIAYAILSIAFAVLSFRIIRGVPMFAIVFLPAITANLDTYFRQIISFIRNKLPHFVPTFSVVGPVTLIALVLWGGVLFRTRITQYQVFGLGLTPTSEEPIDFFKEQHLKGPILNDTDIGSYLIWYLYPSEKVFSDNRFADAYSKEFLEGQYTPTFSDPSRWNEMLDKYKFNTIILNHYNRGNGMVDFIFNRIYDLGWVWVYAGRDAVIFVRNTQENEAVINKYVITQNNFVEKMQSLAQAGDYHGQVAAADLFAYAGQAKLAISQYERILSRWPHMGKIWFLVGRNELLRADQANADTAKALLALQRAIKEGYKTPMSYSYLALAYYRLGDTAKAQVAVRKELKIDPKSKDGKAWQDIFLRDKLKKIELEDGQ